MRDIDIEQSQAVGGLTDLVTEPVHIETAPPAGSALMRAIEILDVVAGRVDKPKLADICRAVNLPKATVYRILGTLEHAGFVSKEPGAKRYECGHRLHELSMRVLQNSPSRGPRHAILEELVEQTGETCNLTVPNVHTIAYIDRVEASWPLRISLGVGSNVPIYASASGKLFLSAMTRRSRERFVRSTPLVRYTSTTLTDPTQLLAELEAIKGRDYAFDSEEYLPGISCLAVPVRNRDGETVAAVAAHGPTSRLSSKQALEFLPYLRSAADAISLTLEG